MEVATVVIKNFRDMDREEQSEMGENKIFLFITISIFLLLYIYILHILYNISFIEIKGTILSMMDDFQHDRGSCPPPPP